MKREQLFNELKETVTDVLGYDPGEIKEDSILMAHLGCDELDLSDIAYELEFEYKIPVNDEEFDSIKTFGNLVDLVFKKLNN